MTKQKFNPLFKLIVIAFVSVSCVSNYENSAEGEKKVSNTNYKHLNITILLDLSDRISNKKNPGQDLKDIEFILNVVENYKKLLSKKGVVRSKDRIKLIYYPILNFPQVSVVADSLNIKFDELEITNRKQTFNSIKTTYESNLQKLYSIFSNLPNYNGSDLFNYFKHRIIYDCIEQDDNYINLLVILTDGYLYSYDNKINIGNRFSYIGPLAMHLTQFRSNPIWEQDFDSKDYGFIKIDNDLSKLFIIAAEFNPAENYPIDFDILKKYWAKWFEEQKVEKSNYLILRTDHSIQNKNVVDNFFKNIIFKQIIE